MEGRPVGRAQLGLSEQTEQCGRACGKHRSRDNVQDRPREASGRPEGLDRRARRDACCVRGSGCGAGSQQWRRDALFFPLLPDVGQCLRALEQAAVAYVLSYQESFLSCLSLSPWLFY